MRNLLRKKRNNTMANFNLNKVTLGGRITHDLEIKQTPQGTAILSFSIAVNRKNNKTQTDFINCKAFGKTAETICKYFKKGSTICICGNIQVGNWQDQNGQKRTSTDVVVDEFFFVDSRNEVSETTYAQGVTPKFEEIGVDDELPF